MSAAERDQEGETGKISYVMRSSELPQMLHQDKRDAAGVRKVVGRLTQDSEVREREEETRRDVGERGGGEEAGLGRDLERDQKKMDGDFLGQERQPLTPRPLRKGNQWWQGPVSMRQEWRQGPEVRSQEGPWVRTPNPGSPDKLGIHRPPLPTFWENLQGRSCDTHFIDAETEAQ